MKDKLYALRDLIKGSRVIIAGNGPSLRLFDPSTEGVICTVNAGLCFFEQIQRSVDLYWVQDRRMLIDKKHLVLPYLHMPKFIAFNSDIRSLHFHKAGNSIPVNMLGNFGFSKEPEIGVFHGFNAVYGLIQLVFGLQASEIILYGVDLKYFSTETRFYQSKRGFDVDLHRSNEQVYLMSKAIQNIRRSGVNVTVVGNSMLHHSCV